MADSATHPTNQGTGHFDEKAAAPVGEPAPYQSKPKLEDDDEDEDIDALIEDLESQDGHQEEEEEEVGTPGGKKAFRIFQSGIRVASFRACGVDYCC